MINLAKEIQSRNACALIRFTESGMVKKNKDIATEESTKANLDDTLRNGDTCEGTAAVEGAGPDSSDRAGDCQTHQRCAAESGMVRLVKDLQSLKTASSISATEFGIVKLLAFKGCTSLTSLIQTCQRGAAFEGEMPNPCHRVRDGNARQRTAAFAGTCLISSTVSDPQVFKLTASFFGAARDAIDAVQHMHHSIGRNATLSHCPRL